MVGKNVIHPFFRNSFWARPNPSSPFVVAITTVFYYSSVSNYKEQQCAVFLIFILTRAT